MHSFLLAMKIRCLRYYFRYFIYINNKIVCLDPRNTDELSKMFGLILNGIYDLINL